MVLTEIVAEIAIILIYFDLIMNIRLEMAEVQLTLENQQQSQFCS